jgi:hypothetical protein
MAGGITARGSAAHPPIRGLDRPHGTAPGAGPGRMRGTGAHHPGVFRHVDRGDPVMDPLAPIRQGITLGGKAAPVTLGH